MTRTAGTASSLEIDWLTIPNSSPSLTSMVTPRVGVDPWEKALHKLLAMRAFEDDWDGEGSRRPQLGNVDTAIAWINKMRRRYHPSFAPQVMPGTNGEVSLIWQTASEYFEAEITAPDRFEWMSVRYGHPAEFCVTNGDLPKEEDCAS